MRIIPSDGLIGVGYLVQATKTKEKTTMTQEDPIAQIERGEVPQKMSVSERVSVEGQLRDRESMLKNEDELENTKVGTSGLDAEVHKLRRMVERDKSFQLTDQHRIMLSKKRKQLIDLMVPDMPTYDEMWLPTGTRESNRAVRKNIAFEQKHAKNIQQYQYVMRLLEPNDPDAGSIEEIRPS
jgi:hypothetical protein